MGGVPLATRNAVEIIIIINNNAAEKKYYYETSAASRLICYGTSFSVLGRKRPHKKPAGRLGYKTANLFRSNSLSLSLLVHKLSSLCRKRFLFFFFGNRYRNRSRHKADKTYNFLQWRNWWTMKGKKENRLKGHKKAETFLLSVYKDTHSRMCCLCLRRTNKKRDFSLVHKLSSQKKVILLLLLKMILKSISS